MSTAESWILGDDCCLLVRFARKRAALSAMTKPAKSLIDGIAHTSRVPEALVIIRRANILSNVDACRVRTFPRVRQRRVAARPRLLL